MAQAAVPSARGRAKRDAILDVALEAFAEHGYLGTTTDRLAAQAAVSKQTLYKLFGDKHGVFSALIERACDAVVDPFVPLRERMESVDSAEAAVRLLAEQFSTAIVTPHIQKLRRLVIAEAPRFPDLGRLYWEAGFGRTIESLAACLDVLHRRGLLLIDDTERAAHHLAGLLLWIPSNRFMFDLEAARPEADELEAIIADGTRAFSRAYAPAD